MGKKPYSRVYLEVTNVCNKVCSFCIGTKRAPRNMTLAEVDLITDKLRPFTDYIYFSKRFKSITGLSPAEYKKRIKE